LQDVATGSDDGDHRQCRLQQRPGKGHRDVALVVREELHAEQHGRDHEILEQQHRERDAADRRGRAPLLFQQLHHDRGRGHGEAEAEHDRAAAGNAEHRKTRADGQRRQRELQPADAGDVAAQRPQPGQR
jgi:hypothetical protein